MSELTLVFVASVIHDWKCQPDSVQDIVALDIETVPEVDDFEPCVCSLRAPASDDVDVVVKRYEDEKSSEENRVTLGPGKQNDLNFT